MQKIRKGDRVKIITGKAAASGKDFIGTVRKVFPRKGMVLIEGYNMVKRHSKPSLRNQRGGIVEKEAPIHISNVMLVLPQNNEGTRVSFRKNEQGEKMRYSNRIKHELD